MVSKPMLSSVRTWWGMVGDEEGRERGGGGG